MKKNFTFLISTSVLIVTLLLFFRTSPDTEGLPFSPTYEYPVLYYSSSAGGATQAAVLYDEPSLYGRVLVFDDTKSSERYLLIDGVLNNRWNFETKGIPGRFKRIASLMDQHSGPISNVAMVGLGAGLLLQEWDQASESTFSVDVAEINPKVVEAAREYFDLPNNSSFHFYEDDGRHFLLSRPNTYDVIVIDLCDITTANAHLFTKDFYEAVRPKLTSDSALFITTLNILTNDDGFSLARRVAHTLSSTFDNVYIMGPDLTQEGQEGKVSFVTFIASNSPLTPSVRESLELNQWSGTDSPALIYDGDIASIVRAHEPVMEWLRADFMESYGPRLFLEQ